MNKLLKANDFSLVLSLPYDLDQSFLFVIEF